tara:strand:+ start:4602 stop:4703 length:102 start_codon:yes stop_codon:yes gene_type:complete
MNAMKTSAAKEYVSSENFIPIKIARTNAICPMG